MSTAVKGSVHLSDCCRIAIHDINVHGRNLHIFKYPFHNMAPRKVSILNPSARGRFQPPKPNIQQNIVDCNDHLWKFHAACKSVSHVYNIIYTYISSYITSAAYCTTRQIHVKQMHHITLHAIDESPTYRSHAITITQASAFPLAQHYHLPLIPFTHNLLDASGKIRHISGTPKFGHHWVPSGDVRFPWWIFGQELEMCRSLTPAGIPGVLITRYENLTYFRNVTVIQSDINLRTAINLSLNAASKPHNLVT